MTDETLLFRQVHPAWVQHGKVTSQAFRPTPKDQKQLSVYDGDLIDAAASWSRFTGTLSLGSVGVLAVTVAECGRFSLPVVPDPQTFREHVLVDFSAFGNNDAERRSKQLRAAAEARGWQFRPESE